MDLPVRHSVRGRTVDFPRQGRSERGSSTPGKKQTTAGKALARTPTRRTTHLLEPTRQLQRSARRMTAWGECRSGDSATGGTARFARRNRTGRGPTWRATVKFCERQPRRWWHRGSNRRGQRRSPRFLRFFAFVRLELGLAGCTERSSWP
jgi:hypothetical protein